MKFPEAIARLLPEAAWQTDTVGMSRSSVLLFEDRVLKIGQDWEESRREARLMEWLQGRLPVPEVLCRETAEGRSYLLMTRLPGRMLCDEAYMERPEELTALAAQGLKLLWQTDISQCPVDARLDVKLAMARYNIEHGLVDLDNVEPETFGPGGFQGPEDLLRWLEEHRPPEDLVFSHGDYCLPNVFARDGAVSGFLDLGRGGAADRYQDIALCYRSLLHNYGGKYSGRAYEGFSPELLFQALDLQPDWEKIRYYILLDELF